MKVEEKSYTANGINIRKIVVDGYVPENPEHAKELLKYGESKGERPNIVAIYFIDRNEAMFFTLDRRLDSVTKPKVTKFHSLENAVNFYCETNGVSNANQSYR